jgi:hypothetical protein
MIQFLLYVLLASTGVYSLTKVARLFLSNKWLVAVNSVAAALFTTTSAFFTWAFFTDIQTIVNVLSNIIAVFAGLGVSVV